MFTQLLDVFGFLSVLLRGGALALESLVLGGAIFSVWVLRPLEARWRGQGCTLIDASRRLIFCSAAALAAVQVCYVAADCAVLAGTTDLRMQDLVGANFFIGGVGGACAALLISVITAPGNWKPTPLLLAPAADRSWSRGEQVFRPQRVALDAELPLRPASPAVGPHM